MLKIVIQRAAVAVSCVSFWYLLTDWSIPFTLRSALLSALALLACVEKLCSVMNMVAVERDWVGHRGRIVGQR
jgi:solute carrier family 40 (iron-regulated transporter), member 1